MDVLMVVLLTVIVSLFGILLLRVAKESVDGVPVEDPVRLPVPALPIVAVLMSGSNLVAALVLQCFYHLNGGEIARTLLTLSLLWACAWADAKAYLIPNRVLLLGTVAAVVVIMAEVLFEPEQAVYLVSGRIIAALALLLASLLCRVISPQAVGMGDVKLLAVLGLGLGMDLVWSALFCSFVILFFYCIFLLITKRAKRNDSIPFAPAMLVGTFVAVLLTGI